MGVIICPVTILDEINYAKIRTDPLWYSLPVCKAWIGARQPWIAFRSATNWVYRSIENYASHSFNLLAILNAISNIFPIALHWSKDVIMVWKEISTNLRFIYEAEFTRQFFQHNRSAANIYCPGVRESSAWHITAGRKIERENKGNKTCLSHLPQTHSTH